MEEQSNESKEGEVLHLDENHLKTLAYFELDTVKNFKINQDDAIIKQFILSNENVSQVFVLHGNQSILVVFKSAQLNTPEEANCIKESIKSEFGIHLNQTSVNCHLFLTCSIDDAKLGLLSKDKYTSVKLIESKTGLKLKKIKKNILFVGYLFQFGILEKMFADYENHVIEPIDKFTEWKDKYENSVHKYELCVNKHQIYVFKADCSELNTDLIVNFTNPNLHPGYTGDGISRRIREKAGKQMQECLKKILQAKHSNLEDSDLCDTKSSGKLRCKHVIHSVCPQWSQHVKNKILNAHEIDLEKFENLIRTTFMNIFRLTQEEKFSNCESIALGVSASANGGSFDLPLEVFVHYMFACLLDTQLVNAKKICLVSLEDNSVIKLSHLLKQYSEMCANTLWAMPESPLGRLVAELRPIEQLSINCAQKEKLTNCTNSPSSSSSTSISPIRIVKSSNRRIVREHNYYPIQNGEIYVRKINESCAGYERYRSVLITFEIFDGIQNEHHPKPGCPYKGLVKRAYLPDVKEHMELLAFYKRALKNGILFKLEWSKKFSTFVVQLNSDVLLKTSLNSGGKFGYPDMNYIDDLLVKARTSKF